MNRGSAAWHYKRGKPEAESLKRWVNHDILFSIRKAGDDRAETMDVRIAAFWVD
jgi:prophage antirepressor-like protein